jgi:diguanylate cyclase (GGDEF)-like protein/PAS domain S-box-containing protein
MKLLTPDIESARLKALNQYRILDTLPEEVFEQLTWLAAYICGTQIAFIGLMDSDRLWLKSKFGLKDNEIPRDISFCSHTILERRIFIAQDALKDERFADSPLVRFEPNLRFYAGVPLITFDGYAIGTLCVADRLPRALSEEQQKALCALADQVIMQLELRRNTVKLAQANDEVKGALAKIKRMEKTLRDSLISYRRILEISPEPIAIHSEGKIDYINPVAAQLLGASSPEELVGQSILKFTHPDYREIAKERIQQIQEEGIPAGLIEEKFIRLDGHVLDGEITSIPFTFEGRPAILSIARDITERKQAEARITHLAYHDLLTDLPNQVWFKEKLVESLGARKGEQIIAVLLLNLDRFKNINDTLGHPVGDRLLQNVAERLTKCVDGHGVVSRFAGDEFAVLINGANTTEEVAAIAECLHDALKQPFIFGEHELFITASIGISLCPFDGADDETLMKKADVALSRAKEDGRSNYHFYTAGRTSKDLKQLVLENSLRRGLEREEFVVYYQPQVDIASGDIVGMEALVRWRQPELGLVPPSEFIHIAEITGLIVPLGRWVLRTACAQNKAWQDAGFASLNLSVNLSARQFQQPNLIEMVAEALKDTGLSPSCLELEVTESSVMSDAERAAKTLQELKEMGVRISIDDFGTGYSSLSYLKTFPIDKLKIDKSFVRDAPSDSSDKVIVKAIINLGHSLNLKVIAEGGETIEHLKILRRLKCDELQGFFFSEPLPADVFRKRMLEGEGQYFSAYLNSLEATTKPRKRTRNTKLAMSAIK